MDFIIAAQDAHLPGTRWPTPPGDPPMRPSSGFHLGLAGADGRPHPDTPTGQHGPLSSGLLAPGAAAAPRDIAVAPASPVPPNDGAVQRPGGEEPDEPTGPVTEPLPTLVLVANAPDRAFGPSGVTGEPAAPRPATAVIHGDERSPSAVVVTDRSAHLAEAVADLPAPGGTLDKVPVGPASDVRAAAVAPDGQAPNAASRAAPPLPVSDPAVAHAAAPPPPAAGATLAEPELPAIGGAADSVRNPVPGNPASVTRAAAPQTVGEQGASPLSVSHLAPAADTPAEPPDSPGAAGDMHSPQPGFRQSAVPDDAARVAQPSADPQQPAPAPTVIAAAVDAAPGSDPALSMREGAVPAPPGHAPVAPPHSAPEQVRTVWLSTLTGGPAGELTLTRGPAGQLDIAISPAELGTVRVELSGDDGRLVLAIHAERPETADLLRRHLDVLAAELRAMGLAGSGFAFGQEARSGQPALVPMHRDDATAATPAVIPALAPPRAGNGQLDLRL